MEASKAIEIGIKLDISFNNSSVFDLFFETDTEFGEQHGINIDSCYFVFRYDFQTGILLDWTPKEGEKLAGTRIPYEDMESEMASLHQINIGDGLLNEGALVFSRHGEDLEELSSEDSARAEEINEELTPQLYYKIAKAVLDKIR